MKTRILLTVLITALPLSLRATTVIRMDMERLSKRAEVVAVGRCIENIADWNEGRTQIYSTITIQVSQYLKGFLGSRISFKQLGGAVGQVSSRVPGMPEFKPGREVVIFLAKDTAGKFQVLGMSQGKFDVLKAGESSVKMVKPESLEGLHLLGPVSQKKFVGSITMDAFIKKVKSYVE